LTLRITMTIRTAFESPSLSPSSREFTFFSNPETEIDFNVLFHSARPGLNTAEFHWSREVAEFV